MGTKANLIEIFRTAQGAVYQCNRRNCYWVEFANGISPFTFQDLKLLKKQVEAVNIGEMAQNTHRTADVVILMPHRSERCFVLTLTEVLYFRELLQGAKVMIELNSLVYDTLHAMAV